MRREPGQTLNVRRKWYGLAAPHAPDRRARARSRVAVDAPRTRVTGPQPKEERPSNWFCNRLSHDRFDSQLDAKFFPATGVRQS